VVHGEPHIRKSNKKNQERESRGAGAPLSLGSFKPNQEHEALAKTLGVSIDKELDSFRNLYAGKSTNYDYAFTRWLHCAKEYRDKKATMAAMKATTRSVVEEPVRPRGEDWTKTNFAPSIRSVESILTEQSLMPPKPPTPEELAAEAARLERRKLVVMFTLEERMRFVSEGIFEEKLRDAAKGDFSWRESGQKNKGTSLSG